MGIPQKAALMWISRIMTFVEHMSGNHADGQLASLDCHLFLEEPAGTLRKLCKHLGIKEHKKQIEAVSSGPLFRKEAKHGQLAFNSKSRARITSDVRHQFASEIDSAMQWAETCVPESSWIYKLPYGLDCDSAGK